jgi:hypothetical protein
MGAKYLPTKKDLKASQRYFENKHPLPHTRKSATALPKKKDAPAAVATTPATPTPASKGAGASI